MATVNILLRTTYQSKDKTYPVVIRVEHNGRQRIIAIGYKVGKAFWKDGQVTAKHPDARIINSAITSKLAEIKKYLADCSLHNKPVHLDLIGTGRQSYSFTEYLDHRAKQYKAVGKPVMRQKVERFARELRASFKREVFFDDINADSLRELERWQIDQGNVQNTRHKKFKFLGEFYTHAIDEGKAPSPNPFKKYKINPAPVKKEKLTAAEIATLENLKLKPGSVKDARNLFLFSFYAKGLRFGNCIMLRRKDISSGRINVKTSKGGKFISIKIHARLQGILDQYDGKEFVFPFVNCEPEDPEEYIELVNSRNSVVNYNLKIVAKLALISKPLTFHIARHSFAFLLKLKTDNINVIQDSLGHSDQRITATYLKALDDEFLDNELEKLYGA